ncbi:Concanavalin A-like lectin/glucanase superfamily [Cynara cardunculus var. scolymus]|uniref:Concanavalin A-like lectin/glucanase superfamily n=2 Tax=Cynara cardunculus var. scolymus TaxID=59895 RepID=A0A103YN27_CYNCS|nr:Concanavalin A-like lectin/glucanase superfamily [Cynara cardunculus var. scolymus]
MASLLTSRYLITLLYFLTFCFKSLIADSNSSFSFNNFGSNSSFESVLALYGDAKVVNGSSSLQLTAPLVSSAGRLIYKNPIKFYSGIPKKLVSFSTYFSFSMWSDSRNGDGLAFVVFSDGYPVDLFDDSGSFGLSNGDSFKFLSVEFDTSMDSKYGDMNGNHVGIDLSSFVSSKAANLSSLNLGVNNGNRLQVWIDYESSSRRLEVRISKFGETRPFDPLLFEQIDLPKIWPENEGFFVGLSSSNGNSTQLCNVYSWSFKTRQSPDWMHSEPLEPMVFKEKKENEIKIHKENDCVMRILSALILGIGLGALGSFIGMFIWTIFANKRPIAPEEYAMTAVAHDKVSVNEKQ